MRTIDADNLIKDVHEEWDPVCIWDETGDATACEIERLIDAQPTVDLWHYPAKGEIPDKDWSKHPNNVSKECFVLTKNGIGTIARWDNDYKTWFERMSQLHVTEVIAWQYFIPPKEET